MADEKTQTTNFDVWFFRVVWAGLLGVLAVMTIWMASLAIDIAMAGGEGAGRKASVFLAVQMITMAALAWAVVRTPRQWRAFVDRAAANAPHVATIRRHRMIDWLRRTWDETNPMRVFARPPPNTWSAIDIRLRNEGWDMRRVRCRSIDKRSPLWWCGQVYWVYSQS